MFPISGSVAEENSLRPGVNSAFVRHGSGDLAESRGLYRAQNALPIQQCRQR